MTTRPLNIGFIGLGFGAHVAESLMSGPSSKYFKVAAVCDADGDRLSQFCARHSVKGCGSLHDMLADPDISVVGLFSGPIGRASLLREIIRAGKDVMTTKPFEMDPVAAREVLEEAGRLGRTIHLNSPAAEPPEYLRQIDAWREEFSLGQPVSCHAEMLVSYRERADGRWLDDPQQCPAAPIFRIGVYSLHDLMRVFGRVHSVQVLSSRLFTQRPTADNAQLSLRFENGALGSIQASFCVDNGQHYANALTFNFERGSIYRNVFPVAYGTTELTSRLRLAATRPGGKEVICREWESSEVMGAYPWAAFHAAVVGSRAVETPVAEIVNGVAVLSAMGRAERSGNAEHVWKISQ